MKYFITSIIIVHALIAIGQPGISDKEWLKTITANAINKAPNRTSFLKAPSGPALYFTKAGDIDVPYLVYVPIGYDPARSQPAAVFLHGAILARDSFQYKSAEIAVEPIFSIADTFNTIVIFPFARQDFKWAGGQIQAFENIIAIIKQVEQDYNIDKKKIYIGGISMGGNATFWFINNKPEMFAGFYTFSAMPGSGGNTMKYANITTQKPLYSINAKDDPVFPYIDVEAAHQQHKDEAPGWHFSTVETGGHRFIYSKGGDKYVKSLLSNLLQSGIK